MPKPTHPVWSNFNVIAKTDNKGNWAQCKMCKKELQEWWKLLAMNINDPRWLNWDGKEAFQTLCEQLTKETKVDWDWEPDDDVPLIDLCLRPDPE
ncbi:hypothetical protein EVAR_68222_1 [Eumeta japonica]|uniref:Uncharacterized protein n=1 Tax=Eumeta variegata TaxID=151549 RepID=A0A4C1ZMA3_EUMVA|nr:hypothetical protein EVAR_68222_1 [Eumeta japonica]